MEWLLAHCSALLAANTPVMTSLLFAGIVGSFAHCSIMCAPMTASQMLQLKSQGQNQRLMGLFHAGRISVYAGLGVVASLMATVLFSGQLEPFRHILLFLAGGLFIASALRPRQTHQCGKASCCNTNHTQPFAIALKGMAMGLMPCGMVLAALMLAATLPPLQAMMGMALFGLGTVPILQLAGMSTLALMRRHPQSTALASRGLMGASGLMLCALALN